MHAEFAGSESWAPRWRRDAEHLHDRLHDHLHRATREHHERGPGRRGGFGPGQFGRGFPFGPGFGGGHRRAGRGDIRAAILALLAETPMHGYQIIQELGERSGGMWRPSPGSVYPTLQQLEDEGLVTAAESEAGRRVFELTDAGKAEAATATRGGAPWEQAAAGPGAEAGGIREVFLQVAAAAWQVGQAGTGRQQAAAVEILRETRRRLYQLLAEDAPEAAPEAAATEGDQPAR